MTALPEVKAKPALPSFAKWGGQPEAGEKGKGEQAKPLSSSLLPSPRFSSFRYQKMKSMCRPCSQPTGAKRLSLR